MTASPYEFYETEKRSYEAGAAGETIKRVTLARDLYLEDPDNLLGRVHFKPVAVSTYAFTVYKSAALEAHNVVKNTAGTVYKVFGSIDASAATDVYYILLIDSATVPSDGTVTLLAKAIVVNHTNGTPSTFSKDYTPGYVYGTNGLVISCSTTEFTKTASGSVASFEVCYK